MLKSLVITFAIVSMIFIAKAYAKNNQPEQAVLIYLDGKSLPEQIYEEYDLATIEDQLEALLKSKKSGVLDGHEFQGEEVVLFLYGSDAKKLFADIRETLEQYPLCKGARIVMRSGPPGSKQEEIRLP